MLLRKLQQLRSGTDHARCSTTMHGMAPLRAATSRVFRDTAIRRSELLPLERSSGMRVMRGAVLSLTHARALQPDAQELCCCPASRRKCAPWQGLP